MTNYDSLSPQSRVWVYQSNRALTPAETNELTPILSDFTRGWAAHGKDLTAHGEIYHDHFLVLFADETRNPASGCSIDSSTRFVKEVEQRLSINLFDRLTVALWIDNKVKLATAPVIAEMLDAGTITPETLMFNNTIQTKEQFESRWIISIRESWLSKSLKLQTVD